MNQFLNRILESKRLEVAAAKQQKSLEIHRSSIRDLPPTRGFAKSLAGPGLSVIAEIKKASPSAGTLTTHFDHCAMGREYEAGGASALSVLTDKPFFSGDIRFLEEIRQTTRLPILRKDFVIDEYQIYETRTAGADALLLIARILEQETLRKFYETGSAIGLDLLVEVHNEADIGKARMAGASLIGINNRDLDDFSVSLDVSIRLRPLLPPSALAVSESGIRRIEDVRLLKEAGFNAVLVGEGLVKADNRMRAVQELLAD